MKEKYEELQSEVIVFETSDVIADSDGTTWTKTQVISD